jgi:hypothetical protein
MFHAFEAHGIAGIAREIAAIADTAVFGGDQCD